MERYIGIDVHQASCTVAVLSETGRQLRVMVVETNGEALVGTIRSVAGRRHVVLEEGTQAGWLVGVLQGHAAEVVVAQVAASRGQKSDERDAYGLAEALRVGTIQRVFKDPHCFRDLGQRARVYRMLTGDLVRIKNRLKSLFRARAITAAGQKLYNPCHRAEWLGKLDSASCLVAEPLFEQLDAVRELQLRAQCAMVETSHRHPVSRRLETIPGLGSIRVAQLLPIVVTPSRFRTRRQLWAYCGLGIVMRSSSDWKRSEAGWQRAAVMRTRGLNRNFNRPLKHIFKGAALTVIQSMSRDPLHHHYRRLLEGGTKPNLARLTIARRIAAITLALWKNAEVYDPKKITPNQSSP